MMTDRTKLPKWAQNELKDLERERDDLARRLDMLNGLHEKSRVKVGYTAPLYLDNQEPVIFQMSPKDSTFDSITVGLREDGVLDISGGTAIVVSPRSSNHVHIRLRED